MLGNEAQVTVPAKLLDPVSAAATVNATSGWVDVRGIEGDVQVIAQVGALTGSITWTVEDATDGAGSGGANFPGLNEGAFAAGAANQTQKRTVKAKATRGFIRLVGTIVTGPALVAAAYQGRPKNF
jgi:hypothetical protein